MKILVGALLAGLMIAPTAAAEDPTRNALLLCKAIDSTGLASAPCEVGARTISISVDMASNEARNFCTLMQDYSQSNDMGFGGNWKLEVKSPYSGGQSIAFCMLP